MEGLEELVKALADGRAVALVGSGASVPSGLPTWRDFLRNFYQEFKPADVSDNPSWKGVSRFIETEGELLLAAELLEQLISPQDYGSYIESVFLSSNLKPSDIHRAIARLPLNVLLTTNFDRLLEGAYRETPLVFNWTEPQEILQNVRLGGKRIIVKMHGTAEKHDTVRLTRTHFRDQQHHNPAFNECLKILLLSRTFLFVGYSLRDSDLLKLIDEAKVQFRDRFGPHYAILPADETDKTFSEYLRRALGVVVIPYDPGTNGTEKTANVVAILRAIAGKVARIRHARMPLPNLSDTTFCRLSACQKLLEQAVDLTGSIRGDICLLKDETNRKLVRTVIFPQGDFEALPEPTMDSVTGTTYLEPNDTGDCTYLPDTSTIQVANKRLRDLGYTATWYKV